MPTVKERFTPEGATLASGVREALSDGGVAIYLNLDPTTGLDVDYTADALPASASPAWTKGGGQSESVSGGELSLNDASAADTITYTRTEAGMATTSPALIGGRIKVASENNSGIPNFIGMADGTKQLGVRFRPSVHRAIFCDFGSGDRGGGLTDYLLDITAYHTYELCKINNTRLSVYIDGLYRISIDYALFGGAGTKQFEFGCPSGAGQSALTVDRIYYKIATLWPSTSPTFDKDFDSRSNDTVWDMSTIKMVENLFGEEGNVKYQYGAGNSAAPTLNGSFLTEAQIQAESDPTGRFLRIQGQLNGDGSQDAGWGGFEIELTTPAAAGGIFVARRRVA